MLQIIIRRFKVNMGLATLELLKQNKRVGFSIHFSSGFQETFAQTNSPTDHKVGRFFVNKEALDRYIPSISSISNDDFLYIDEIGEMQLLSANFKELVDMYINSNNDLIATVSAVHKNKFIDSLLGRGDVIIFKITPHNRSLVKDLLTISLSNRNVYNTLPSPQQKYVVKTANKYIHENNTDSYSKLFNNAIHYYSEGKIIKNSAGNFTVLGNNNAHKLELTNSVIKCDCPLANGRAPFKRSGECSHVQSVQMYRIA